MFRMKNIVLSILTVFACCIVVTLLAAGYAHSALYTLRDSSLPTGLIAYEAESFAVTAYTSTGIPLDTAETSEPSETVIASEIEAEETVTYILNINSHKIHYSTCSSVSRIKENNKVATDDFAEAVRNGFEPCKICNPTQ